MAKVAVFEGGIKQSALFRTATAAAEADPFAAIRALTSTERWTKNRGVKQVVRIQEDGKAGFRSVGNNPMNLDGSLQGAQILYEIYKSEVREMFNAIGEDIAMRALSAKLLNAFLGGMPAVINKQMKNSKSGDFQYFANTNAVSPGRPSMDCVDGFTTSGRSGFSTADFEKPAYLRREKDIHDTFSRLAGVSGSFVGGNLQTAKSGYIAMRCTPSGMTSPVIVVMIDWQLVIWSSNNQKSRGSPWAATVDSTDIAKFKGQTALEVADTVKKAVNRAFVMMQLKILAQEERLKALMGGRSVLNSSLSLFGTLTRFSRDEIDLLTSDKGSSVAKEMLETAPARPMQNSLIRIIGQEINDRNDLSDGMSIIASASGSVWKKLGITPSGSTAVEIFKNLVMQNSMQTDLMALGSSGDGSDVNTVNMAELLAVGMSRVPPFYTLARREFLLYRLIVGCSLATCRMIANQRAGTKARDLNLLRSISNSDAERLVSAGSIMAFSETVMGLATHGIGSSGGIIISSEDRQMVVQASSKMVGQYFLKKYMQKPMAKKNWDASETVALNSILATLKSNVKNMRRGKQVKLNVQEQSFRKKVTAAVDETLLVVGELVSRDAEAKEGDLIYPLTPQEIGAQVEISGQKLPTRDNALKLVSAALKLNGNLSRVGENYFWDNQKLDAQVVADPRQLSSLLAATARNPDQQISNQWFGGKD